MKQTAKLENNLNIPQKKAIAMICVFSLIFLLAVGLLAFLFSRVSFFEIDASALIDPHQHTLSALGILYIFAGFVFIAISTIMIVYYSSLLIKSRQLKFSFNLCKQLKSKARGDIFHTIITFSCFVGCLLTLIFGLLCWFDVFPLGFEQIIYVIVLFVFSFLFLIGFIIGLHFFAENKTKTIWLYASTLSFFVSTITPVMVHVNQNGLRGTDHSQDKKAYDFDETTPPTFDLNKYTETINFNKPGVKVMILTDLHFMYSIQDYYIQERIRKAVHHEHPDLILILGDNFGLYFNHALIVHKFVNFFESLNVCWAPIFGNHDDNIVYADSGNNSFNFCDVDKNYFSDEFEHAKHCLYQYGPRLAPDISDTHHYAFPTQGNYVINVAQNNVIQRSFVMMDCANAYMYDTRIDKSQGVWYNWIMQGFNAKKISDPSLFSSSYKQSLCKHIPLECYNTAYSNAMNDKSLIYYGSKGENFPGDEVPQDFEENMWNANITDSVFAGHNHLNDYSVKYIDTNDNTKQMRLTCAVKSSEECYHSDAKVGYTMFNMSNGDYDQYPVYWKNIVYDPIVK